MSPDGRLTRLLLIADDLTGALDSAVAFAATGRRVAVARTPDAAPALAAEAPDVLAVNLGSRDGDAARARARMEALCRALDPRRFDVVMKKVDSRLKGHPGAEAAVLAAAMGNPPCVVLPAIPSMGRVQRGGRIEGEGIAAPIPVAPLFETEVDVPEILADADLDRAVSGGARVLWVGARGLAAALAGTLFDGASAPLPVVPPPMLMAIGSRDPITVAQVDALRGAGVHAAPDGRVGDLDLRRAVEVVRMTDGGEGRDADAAGADFAAGLAARMRGFRPATLLCSGGETADAILARLGIDRLDVLAEIAPGVPVCEIDAPWGKLRLVTKSGGFGARDLLAEIAADCLGTR